MQSLGQSQSQRDSGTTRDTRHGSKATPELMGRCEAGDGEGKINAGAARRDK